MLRCSAFIAIFACSVDHDKARSANASVASISVSTNAVFSANAAVSWAFVDVQTFSRNGKVSGSAGAFIRAGSIFAIGIHATWVAGTLVNVVAGSKTVAFVSVGAFAFVVAVLVLALGERMASVFGSTLVDINTFGVDKLVAVFAG
jgi:hypothetical protein